jgi:hypothetical protein
LFCRSKDVVVDRKRLLAAVEIARRVRLGDVHWGDAAILSEHVLWLASQVCGGAYARAATPTPVPPKATLESLHAENESLRGALESADEKVQMLEQLLLLWHGARGTAALPDPISDLVSLDETKLNA